MELPGQPLTLTIEEIKKLNQELSNFRHDINNNLALITAGLEVIQQKPQLAERMMATVAEQPAKISAAMTKFSAEFDKILQIKR